MQKTRTSLIAAAAVMGLATLAGCGSSSTHAAAPTTAPAASSSTTAAAPSTTAPSSSVTTAPSSGGVTTTTTASPTTTSTSACASANLQASLSDGNGAAGTFSYVLSLTNTGSTACYLDGFPGVSLVTGTSGTQVGAPATRSSQSFSPVRVGPTGSAQAVLYVHDAGNYPTSTCQLTATRGFRVYPPDQTAALFVPQTGEGCANTAIKLLEVNPLVPGPEDPQG